MFDEFLLSRVDNVTQVFVKDEIGSRFLMCLVGKEERGKCLSKWTLNKK